MRVDEVAGNICGDLTSPSSAPVYSSRRRASGWQGLTLVGFIS